MQNYTQTIISQYANSTFIQNLIANYSQYVDPSANFDDFYNNIWNLETASGYGLDVWGRIVGVSRVLQIANGAYFGFQEATPLSALGFNNASGSNPGSFYSGQSLLAPYTLDDTDFLTLIYAKAALNIWDGSIPGCNRILQILFPGQGGYVIDNGNMAMTYYFPFVPTPVQVAIIGQSGCLPRPAGVRAYIQFEFSPPYESVFRLDHSTLDGTDVLS